MLASFNGHDSVARTLLSWGANVNQAQVRNDGDDGVGEASCVRERALACCDGLLRYGVHVVGGRSWALHAVDCVVLRMMVDVFVLCETVDER